MSKKFKLQISMLSDWHIGTGAGIPGSVDKKMMRDSDGFPFIPAKTINGIWRDAMETITQALDEGKTVDWSNFAKAIFGNQPALPGADPTIAPFASTLGIQPARYPSVLRDKINALATSKDQTNKTKYIAALTFIKPGVAIDCASGSARPDYLRFEEMGRVGSVLEAEGEFVGDNETAWALLVVSAHFIERMGGKRRRGAGRCQWKLFDEKDNLCDVNQAIEHLRGLENKPPALPQSKQAAHVNNLEFAASATNTNWQSIPYTLELQTPVSIVTATLGNVAESLDFIPGTYLLTPFIKAIPVALRNEFFQALAAGNIQILPATIQINNERGLPIPKAFSAKKVGGSFMEEGTVFNRFRDENKSGEQLKPYRNGFVYSLANTDQLPSYLNAKKTLSMHNVIEDKVQCPTEEVGGVYARAAIAAGTILRGEIHLSGDLNDKFKSELGKATGNIRLGTSKKDDYGLAMLTVGEAKPLPVSIPTNGKSELIVYLESDLLLRNTNLRHTNLAEDLQKHLNEKLGTQLKLCLKDAVLQTRRIESWQTTWGRPRPTLIAIAAGSCALFTYEGELAQATLQTLQTLQTTGLGERRGEGYGQIRFNPALLAEPAQKMAAAVKGENKPTSKPAAATVRTEIEAFAKLLEDVAWRAEIYSAAAKIAAKLDRRKEIFGFDSTNKGTSQKPSQSQIGGLRSVISRLQSNQDKGIVTGWIEHLLKAENRADKWPEGVLKRLNTLITDEKIIWEKLQPELHLPSNLTTPIESLKTRHWAEAVRTLFYECAHAHKRATEKINKSAKGAGNNG